MARPSDWHNLDLPGDPTPGDPYESRTQGLRFRTFAHDVATVHTSLNAAAKDSALAEANGKAMTAFRGQIGKLPGQLQKLHDSYEIAGDALVAYAAALEIEQHEADLALAKARILRGDLSQAQRNLANATNAVFQAAEAKSKVDNPQGNVPPPIPAQVRQAARNAQYAGANASAAQSQVDSLQAQLADLRTKAQTAGHNQDQAAQRLVSQLDEASNVGIHNKKWYQKVADWVGKHWDGFITLCKWVVALGGILLLFFGGPLAWIVLGAALLVLADTVNKYAHHQAGLGDLLFAVLDCIPVAGKLAMLAKAGKFMEGFGTALKVAKAEKQYATLIKVWHMGTDLKGFNKVAFGFAKNEVKNTLQDFMNGGWNNVKKNFASNAVGNAIGAGLSPLIDKGFSKVPGILYHGNLIQMSQKQYGELAMHMNGKTLAGKGIIGASKALVTSVTKQAVDTTIFGGHFDLGKVGLSTAGGYGDSGLGYSTGIGPAKAAFSG